ncbi:hypothetical protein ACFLYH_00900 [Candidatus Dependentiae bacterium]
MKRKILSYRTRVMIVFLKQTVSASQAVQRFKGGNRTFNLL